MMQTTTTHRTRTLAAMQRSWLFVPGAHRDAHEAALASSCDVIVADLEEMTAPHDRPAARERIVALLAHARACGAFGAVRINRMEEDGPADLEGIMRGHPHAVFLPHAETPEQMRALDSALAECEARLGIEAETTAIVPTIESARGLVRLASLLAASPRIRYCMLASEDLAASLGARRTPRGDELRHARSRFLIEALGAGCHPIDLPCTYRSPATLDHDLEIARQLGFRSKCAVFVEQVDAIHRAFTPAASDARAAQALLDAYRAQGSAATTRFDENWIDAPEASNARRTLERHALGERLRNTQPPIKRNA